jgi:hypothetical protein
VDTCYMFRQYFAPKGSDKICMMMTRLACNRAIESSYWRMDNNSDVGLLMGYVLYRLPIELESDRNRTVKSHRRSWGVCHSLAETCGFIIENPLAGHVSIDWFSWLQVI